MNSNSKQITECRLKVKEKQKQKKPTENAEKVKSGNSALNSALKLETTTLKEDRKANASY